MSNPAPKTLNARGMAHLLAPLLYKSERTIYRDISRSPDSLPPPSRKSGRTKIWLVSDVYHWVAGGKIATNCPSKMATLAESLMFASTKR